MQFHSESLNFTKFHSVSINFTQTPYLQSDPFNRTQVHADSLKLTRGVPTAALKFTHRRRSIPYLMALRDGPPIAAPRFIQNLAQENQGGTGWTVCAEKNSPSTL